MIAHIPITPATEQLRRRLNKNKWRYTWQVIGQIYNEIIERRVCPKSAWLEEYRNEFNPLNPWFLFLLAIKDEQSDDAIKDLAHFVNALLIWNENDSFPWAGMFRPDDGHLDMYPLCFCTLPYFLRGQALPDYPFRTRILKPTVTNPEDEVNLIVSEMPYPRLVRELQEFKKDVNERIDRLLETAEHLETIRFDRGGY